MSKIIVSLILLVGITHSCATASDGQTSTNPVKTPSNLVTQPSESISPDDKPLDCVKLINQFGKASNCKCQPGLTYNSITGRCEKGGRMCTQALVEMINEKTGQCYTARNGCEASDLKSIGWRRRKPVDTCTK